MNFPRIIGVLVFPLFCILASLFGLLADPYFTSALLHSVGKETSVQPTNQLFLSFAGLSEIPGLFNVQEKSHMDDVTQLIRAGFLIFLGIAALFFFCVRKSPEFINCGFYLLCILFVIIAIIPFENLFTAFHLLFFPQGNWMFDANSVIIQTYPFNFFLNYAFSIAAYALFLGVILFIQSTRKCRKLQWKTQVINIICCVFSNTWEIH